MGDSSLAQAMKSRGTIEVSSVEDVPDHASGLPVGMMSAPTVMIEKLPSAESVGEAVTAVTALARYLERKPTHIACIETGDVNSTVSFVAAAELGLPIIDGDGMGRAFPELQMVLPTPPEWNWLALATSGTRRTRPLRREH